MLKLLFCDATRAFWDCVCIEGIKYDAENCTGGGPNKLPYIREFFFFS